MIRYLIFGGITLLISLELNAQTLLSNGLGSSSIFTPKSLVESIDQNKKIIGTTSIKISTTENALSLERTKDFRIKNSTKVLSLGFNVGGAGNGKLSSIFKKGSFVNGATGSLEIGIKFLKSKKFDCVDKFFFDNYGSIKNQTLEDSLSKFAYPYGHYFYVRPFFKGSKFTLLEDKFSKDRKYIEYDKPEWSFTVGYNFWTTKSDLFSSILGVSLSREFSNNINELTKITISEIITDDSDINASFAEQKIVYEGVFKKDKKTSLNLDGYFTPKINKNITIYCSHLTILDSENTTKSNFTTGLIFEKKEKSDNPAIGLIGTFTDVYSEKAFDRFSLNLTTRIGLSNIFR